MHSNLTADSAAYLNLLEQLVRSESPTGDKSACDALADLLTGLLEERGWQVTRHLQETAGDHLEARLATGRSGPSTLLLCHYDTVWPVGTLQEMPVTNQDGLFMGPGALDMKAGIAAAIHATDMLSAAGHEPAGPVTLLLTSDEETGSLTSRELIERLGGQHDRVLVLEPGRDDGALKTGRKGVGDYTVHFRGVSSHAGNSPELGASALRELAHFLLFAESLGEDSKGTTVNVTTASGGSARNVIAEQANAGIDFRVLLASEADRIEESLRTYRPRSARVTVRVEGGLNRPPLEPTEANQALWQHVSRIGTSLGQQLTGAVVGGGSDGNFTSAAGSATLDGLGGVGSGPHARHEQIDVDATLRRVELLAAVLLNPAD